VRVRSLNVPIMMSNTASYSFETISSSPAVAADWPSTVTIMAGT
jgi:hypothetical protein